MRLEQAAEGYALTIPGTWTPLRLGPGEIEGLIGELERTQPDMAAVVRAYLTLTGGSGFSILAYDASLDRLLSGLPPNLNVVVQSSFSLTPDFLAQVLAGSVRAIPGFIDPVVQERVSLPAGEAIRLSYRIQTGPASAPVPVAVVQYLVVSGPRSYVLTFTTSDRELARDAPTFDTIARSLELLP